MENIRISASIMKHIFTTLFICVNLALGIQAQQVIEVAQLTLRIAPGSTEELFYGFAAGDRVLLTVEELGGKAIKEVEMAVYPDQVKLLERETAGFTNREIKVLRSEVYAIRLKNTALLGERNCRVIIKRIPAEARYAAFNTAVQWIEKVDTVYRSGKEEHSGYQRREVEKTKKVLVSADTQVVTLLERSERIYAKAGLLYGDSESALEFTLPANTYYPDTKNPYRKTEVVSWAYWIGVGDEADRSFQQANTKALSKMADAAVSLKLVATGGYGALAVLALKGVALFTNPPKGDNVHYRLLKIDVGGKHQAIDEGSSVTAYRRVDKPLQGTFAFRLGNDNYVDAINVNVKVLAVTISYVYADKTYTEVVEEKIADEALLGKPTVRINRIPVLSDQ